MEKFVKLTAVAAPIDRHNVDTDQILPSRYLMMPRDERYGSYLFRDLRLDRDGRPIADFVLNRPAYRDARILVARRNFGCGSSREGAVFALVDHGMRCVIAESFGDIFYNNACNNGLLPVVLDEAAVTALRAALHETPGLEVTIDLEAQTVAAPGCAGWRFEIDPHRRHRLLNGLDAVDYTLGFEDEMTAFETRYRADAPWLAR